MCGNNNCNGLQLSEEEEGGGFNNDIMIVKQLPRQLEQTVK